MTKTDNLFREIEKIDAHVHQNIQRTALLEEAEEAMFRLVSINTEVPDFPDINKQRQIILQCQRNKPGLLNFITTFSVENWGETGWQDQAIENIKKGVDKGAVAVKIWKNIGMDLRDQNGEFIMADHSSFDPIYAFLEKNDIPLIAHTGEPKNCWMPVDKMTVNSDKDYYSKNPRYHMHLHTQFPDYEEHLKARDNVLSKFTNLRFIGAHLASIEWNVDRLAEWFETFPRAGADLAERICHLQYQSTSNHSKVKQFIEKYQDRIIYGTDQIDDGVPTKDDLQTTIRKKWEQDFRYFSETSLQTCDEVNQPFEGLGLDKNILIKVFRKNALHYYPRLNLKKIY